MTKPNRFKFRAWDKKCKKFVSYHSYLITFFGEITNNEGYYIDYSSDLILMQSTGLLDFHGKEIFESDIVRWKQADGGILPPDTQPKVCEVIWDNDGWELIERSAVDNGKHGRYALIGCHIEVIGNIYEHKHLLKND